MARIIQNTPDEPATYIVNLLSREGVKQEATKKLEAQTEALEKASKKIKELQEANSSLERALREALSGLEGSQRRLGLDEAPTKMRLSQQWPTRWPPEDPAVRQMA